MVEGGKVLEGYDMIAGLDCGNTFANGFDNAGAFVPEDDRKGAFGVFTG